jgi:hypothetical protein
MVVAGQPAGPFRTAAVLGKFEREMTVRPNAQNKVLSRKYGQGKAHRQGCQYASCPKPHHENISPLLIN